MISCYRAEGAKIGGDATLSGAHTWLTWKEMINEKGLNLAPLVRNPIDNVWTDRPSRSKDPLTIHDLKFAGQKACLLSVTVYLTSATLQGSLGRKRYLS